MNEINFFKIETLECIKTVVFIPEIPKVPTVRGGPALLPHPPPLGCCAPTTFGQWAPSLSYLPLLSNISCLIPDDGRSMSD